MRQVIRIFLRRTLTLTATMAMAAALQAQAAMPSGGWGTQAAAEQYLTHWITIPAAKHMQPRAFLLAQNPEAPKEKQPSATPPPNKPQSKSMEQACPLIERKDGKSAILRDEPERAGTKKIGGQTIRSKETPEGE
jgi:hypothetical protein